MKAVDSPKNKATQNSSNPDPAEADQRSMRDFTGIGQRMLMLELLKLGGK